MISRVFKEDIEQIITSQEIPWRDMNNATVLITGATGLIGNVIVHTLSAASNKYGLNLRIIAHVRNALKGEALLRDCGIRLIDGDIRDPLAVSLIRDKVDYIFHCAAITKSADMVAKPVDVITTATDGTRNVLELARDKQSKSVVYLSSMEVYGQTRLSEVVESDLGYLDLSVPRSSYPESKRMCESLCVSYFTQYDVPVKIARLAQTFGAGTPRNDPRVFAQFARSAIAGEDIVLHTNGESRGNYCYISDAVSGLLLLLLKGGNGEIYNVANPGAGMTVREMAELVAGEICHGRIQVKVEIQSDAAKLGYAPVADYKLNSGKLMAFGWQARYGLKEMYSRVLDDWRNE